MKTSLFTIIFSFVAILAFAQNGLGFKPDTTRIDLSAFADLSQLSLHNSKQSFN
jgi:hypothetical protein